MPYSDRHITLVRVGRIVTACAYITLTSNFNQVGNVSVNETIPEGFRPSGDSRAVMRGTDNSGATSFYLYGTADGKMVLNGTKDSVIAKLTADARPAVPVRVLFGMQGSSWGLFVVNTNGEVTVRHRYGGNSLSWDFVDISTTYVTA